MAVYELEMPPDQAPVLFLQPAAGPYRAPTGPLTVIREGEPPTTQWHLPEEAYELLTRSEVYEEIRGALSSVQLSRPARSALENLLDELPG